MVIGIRESMASRIAGILREDIANGVYKSGETLPTIKTLSQRFGVSLTPVNQAFQRLEKEGLVVCRVGSGTYVTDRRPIANPSRVILCAHLEGHIYGTVAARILAHLHELRVYPVMLDAQHLNGSDLLRNALPPSRILITVNSAGFPFEMLLEESIKGKIIIGVLSWQFDDPRLSEVAYRVLVDHTVGARIAAEHLWSRGCRRLVVLGTNSMVNAQDHTISPTCHWGYPFQTEWLARGGTIRTVNARAVPGKSDPMIDPDALCSLMLDEMAQGPTGVFGLRDFEAWQAQDILLSDACHRFDDVFIMGYGNTPWSQAARPPITTIDWNLDEIAIQTCALIGAAVDNTLGPPCCHMVNPVLIPRP